MKWGEKKPSGASINLNVCATNVDGKVCIAGYSAGRLYLSTNYGVNWTEIRPAGNADKNWSCSAIDSDGSNIIVGVRYGRLYTSNDGGATWTERQPAGANNGSWISVASDNNGSHLYALRSGESMYNNLYVSTNSGVSWSEITPAGSYFMNKVACDSDGSFVTVCGGEQYFDGGIMITRDRMYTSTNSGSSWSQRYPNGSSTQGEWYGVDCTSTGSHVVVCGINGLFKSTNSGSSWTKIGTLVYQDAQISADGVYYSIIRSDGVRLSRNGGVDFTLENPAGSGTFNWIRLSQSKEGAYIMALHRTGSTAGLYTGSVFPFCQAI